MSPHPFDSESEAVSLDMLRSFSDKDLRSLLDVQFPGSERYASAADVYMTTNEVPIHAAAELRESDRTGHFSYLGVQGGIDSSLTHLANLHQPDKGRHIDAAFLIDVNEAALEYGQFRLDLLKVCSSPIEYLRAVIPARIDYEDEEFFAQLARDNYHQTQPDHIKIAHELEKHDFPFDPTIAIKKMRQLGYSALKIFRLMKLLVRSEQSFLIDWPARKIHLTSDWRFLIGQVVASDDHWLSVKKPERYQTVQQLQAKKVIRQCKAPLQLIDKSRLMKSWQSGQLPPLGYISTSNVGAIMSDGDYVHFTQQVADLEQAQGTPVEVIYGVYNNNSVDQRIAQEVAPAQVAFADPELRNQSSTKFPDMN